MGLLTNPQTREKLSKLISRYDNLLCCLCYVGGVAYFLALAFRGLNAGNYFSENALLPGLVDADFYNDFGASDHLRNLKAHVNSLKETKKEKSTDWPVGWFTERFREIGLDVYVHNYSFTYPEKLLRGQLFTGSNVYGILRAPRGASTESVVLMAPYRPTESPQDKTYAGLALMLGLAKAFRRHTYWAKDIIFLVTEHEQIGAQAWLDAFHSTPNQYIYAEEMAGRSGPIQAAINLEIATETISQLNIKPEGLNGQLPNLDLINTIVKLCRREGRPALIQKRADHYYPESQEGYLHSLWTMVYMMWHQASGVPTGNHGLFHRYHIEAVTLEGVKVKGARKSMGFVEIGRVIEGVYRSLNNLLERFHQSFFFYILPGTDRYVSIGLYMPPFGVLVLPVLLKAISLWISYGIRKAELAEKAPKTDSPDFARADSFDTVISLTPTLVMGVFFGLGAYFSPRYLIEIATQLKTSPQEGLMYGFLAVQGGAVMHAALIRRKAKQKGRSGPDWKLLKCIGLLGLAVVLGVLSVMNISLAFFIAIAWVPVMVGIQPSAYWILRLFQYLVMLIVSPLGLLVLACIFHHMVLHPTDNPIPAAFTSAQNALLVTVIDTHFYGSLMFAISSLALIPIWSVFWALLWCEPY